MTIRVALNHLTRYRYDRPARLGPQLVRLRPAAHCRTPIQAYSLQVTPAEHFINWQQDPFGNYLARLVIPEPTREFAVEVDLIADMTVINPFDFFLEDYAEQYPFSYPPALAEELAPYLQRREHGDRLRAWLAGFAEELGDGPRLSRLRQSIDFLVALNRRLERDIFYNVRMEPGVQSCETTLQKASGSCRDSAWLLAQILRHLGLASRFVSGYLVQLSADVKPLDGPAGPAEDFTDLHAWTEVYLPGAGWVGLDPTSGLLAGEGHIPLACSPDPGSASPISGVVEQAEVEFFFRNRITRIHEDPRVTKPYDDTQWRLIDALGRRVDDDLGRLDVRLSQGGEPTFVAVDDQDAAEWNTAALGERKRQLAERLLVKLRDRFAPGGVLHFGQGKWYPGEPTPRWALSCFWRADGVPIDRVDESNQAHASAADLAAARRFALALAERLGLSAEQAERYLLAGYEDALYNLWQESQLSPDQDPLSCDGAAAAADPAARRNLAKVLSRGLDTPVGYALPLRYNVEQGRGWVSGPWQLRREQLCLIPGDSPIGFRLPLGALPQAPPLPPPTDPFAPREPLADDGRANEPFPPAGVEANLRSTLCVEPRDGWLYVFLPPMTALKYWLELLDAIHRSAAELGMAVRLEGYPPPADPRLRQFSVSPDPGVIEVNVQPTVDWQTLVELTTELYRLAAETGLGAEKFMLDGRHTGTGGGNHITLGGPSAADSPLLRRPDLLASLVIYWQHHPALSYLFSGQFIGPTSQAPRVDEARVEALYELEIALGQFPPPNDDAPPPWLADRLLRHLLVDLTGNTHRAEFCIDKLYAPAGPTGRLGLLELRAFEMPPHARMSLVQSLLVRALVAHFWQQPYRGRLVRWGSELHDRFMLPHYVEADMNTVVDDLNRAGYRFDPAWLAPFYEFRFPRYGSIQVGDITLELRMAVEPWHVLGEEMAAAGTARYVDSSVERLQVKVSGMTGERHAVVCNGRRLPLRPTGRAGEFIAAVRYKAWQPPSALHPTLPAQVPLTFDVIDLWNGRALGGCRYHVSHPGGRNFDSAPVNAFAAEARRTARFFGRDHTPGDIQPPTAARASEFIAEGSLNGPFEPPAEQPSLEYPCTLDLRRSLD